jgi:hypothetical protein
MLHQRLSGLIGLLTLPPVSAVWEAHNAPGTGLLAHSVGKARLGEGVGRAPNHQTWGADLRQASLPLSEHFFADLYSLRMQSFITGSTYWAVSLACDSGTPLSTRNRQRADWSRAAIMLSPT